MKSNILEKVGIIPEWNMIANMSKSTHEKMIGDENIVGEISKKGDTVSVQNVKRRGIGPNKVLWRSRKTILWNYIK